jgi:Protein of unknown function (DUF4197)
MKSTLLIFLSFLFLSITDAQSIKTDEIAKGLKEALQVGTTRGIDILSKPDGFFGNAAIKILMPPEAAKIEKSLRSLGFNQQVDDAILSMNRAAEDASKEAIPIFSKAITEMSIEDAFGILKGNNDAATKYLQSKTIDSLTKKFRPSIEASLSKVNATKNWNSIVTQYNKFSFKKINPDLAAYVTERSLNGIYLQIAAEEAKIRKDPVARSSDLLKKIFGK